MKVKAYVHIEILSILSPRDIPNNRHQYMNFKGFSKEREMAPNSYPKKEEEEEETTHDLFSLTFEKIEKSRFNKINYRFFFIFF